MSTSYPKVFVDRERNLSSTEKSVFHLGLSLLKTDFRLEAGVHGDLFQGGRYLRIKRNVYSRLHQQKRRVKDSSQLIQERVCMWSARKTLTLTLLSWRPWGHQGVRRRWWRTTARCKPEQKRLYCQAIGLIRQNYVLEETPAVLSLVNPSKNMGTRITGTAVKTTSEMAKELIAKYRTVYH